MTTAVNLLIVAAARELVLTRSVLLWYGMRVYDAACEVGWRSDANGASK